MNINVSIYGNVFRYLLDLQFFEFEANLTMDFNMKLKSSAQK